MKRFLLIVAMAVLPLALAAQDRKGKPENQNHSHSGGGPAQVIKFHAVGEFATLSGSTAPNSSFSLNVSRGSSTTSPTSANLNYFSNSISSDNSTIEFVQINGIIPAGDFTGNNTKRLTLDFDTSQLDPATSFSQSCTFDLNTLVATCGPVPPGTIHLEFGENGLQRTRIIDLLEEEVNGPVTILTHQTADTGSANAHGFVFGAPISSTSARVGINHDSSVQITKK